MTRRIIHVDMDAFFASVEIRERPELTGLPVVVGGRPEGRGVVAAASYTARRYGIHSAMPMAQAVRRCPTLVILPPRGRLYAEVSAQIHAIFDRYTPLVESLSLDEAFLDVSASERLFGDAATIGRQIKQSILSELGLVASVGVAPNKYLAKLASDLNKPDGFLVVVEEAVDVLLEPLPITRLWGVGRKSAERLERLGIRTIGQLRQYPAELLAQNLGQQSARLLDLAHGIDDRAVVRDQEAKSISNETTFAQDIVDAELIRNWLVQLTEQVAARLRRAGLRGRTINLKVRYADFTTVTRAETLERSTDVTSTIRQVVLELFNRRLPRHGEAVRLVGVGVSGFGAEERQNDLFADALVADSQVDQVVDAIRARFGGSAVRRGKPTGS